MNECAYMHYNYTFNHLLFEMQISDGQSLLPDTTKFLLQMYMHAWVDENPQCLSLHNLLRKVNNILPACQSKIL